MNPAIEIKNLSFSYGDTENQLKHINLSVEKGEVIVLTGPSGSGKSTLTRVINGLIPYFFTGALSGEVWLFGKNMAEIPSWERGKYVGNVFQDPRSQFFANEVAGEIAFGCENYGVPHDEIVKRVQGAAEALSITNLLEHKVRYLSYGMRQRVAIASAEAIDPDIYVMDEPSANLDMGATEDFAAFVCLLKKQGKTILIAEHRLYYLRDIADRIVYLNKGEIVSVMTPQEMNILPHEQVFEWGLRSMELLNLPFPANSGKETEQKPLLSVERLHKRFGLHEVLKDVSFSCSPGEIVAIVGPNAAGKSTLGKLLSGLLKEDGGTIRFAEKPLKKSSRREMIWYIMQDLDSQLFGESLPDELLTGKKVTPALKLRADELLTLLNLAEFADRHPATLSGGQKQRLALAVALLNEAPVIVLDEPTSGLDGRNMRSVSKQLRALAEKGHIILMITHDLECALATCSRALVIRNCTLADDFQIDNAERLMAAMRE